MKGSPYKISPVVRFLALILFCAAIWAPGALLAQVYYGTVVGNVMDPSGAAVPGASVTIVNKGTGEKSASKTNGQGGFTLAQLPVGSYQIIVDAPNFKKFVANNVEVHTSTNTEINATLQIGSAGETVTVEANQIQVQTTDASVGEVIDGTQVRELPLNGENFVGLTQLAPGVSAAAGFDGTGKGLQGGVNFSINGNPYTNNLFLVDGVNNNDQGSGRTILVYPATDTIAEFKILTNSYGPEYGQASGGIISITTLSGTNKIHGGFFYSGRNDALDANDWFSNHDGTGKGELRRSDYGYHISGPAIKDKLFLWYNQEWDKEKRSQGFATCVPTDAESAGDFTNAATSVAGTAPNLIANDQCGAQVGYLAAGATTLGAGNANVLSSIPTIFQTPGNPYKIANPDTAGKLIAQFYPSANVNPADQRVVNSGGNNWASSVPNTNDWSEWNVRGDYDVTKNNRATLRWTQDNWTNPFPNNPGFDGLWGDSEYPTVGSSWSQPSKSVMAKLSSTIHSTMVNDVEFGYGHNAIITALGGTRANIVGALDAAYPASFPNSLKTPGEFFGGWGGLNPYGSYQGNASIWNIAPYTNHEDIYTVQDNLSKVRGNHVYKAGVFYGNNAKVENSGNGADRPSLPSTIYCGPGTACAATGGAGATPGFGSSNTGNALTNILLPGSGATPQQFAVSENSVDATAYVAWRDYEFYVQDSWKIRRNVTIDYGFRWSFLREPYGSDNHWANWNIANWSAAEAATNPQDACNGTVIVPGTTPCQDAVKLLAGLGVPLTLSNGTPGPNRSLINQNNHNIAPRVGIAWDLFGNGETALRVGGGQFYQRELVGIDEGMARTAPFVLGGSSNRALDTPAPLTGISVSPNYAKDPRGVIPNSWQWNAAVEQQLRPNTTLSIGYVGNTGVHLTSMSDFNAIPQSKWVQSVFTNAGTAQNALRPAFNFGQIGGFARGGHATYHSLQALFRSQVKRSTFQAAYTWAHSIGNVEEDNSSGSFNQEAITYQGNPSLDKGNTNINRPNVFVANDVLFLPSFNGSNQFIRQSIGGWELNNIFTAAHGNSLTVFANGGYNGGAVSGLIGTGYIGNNRPLLTGINCNAGASGNQILNVNAFTLVGYNLGSIPSNTERRGTCYGAPTTDLDSQLAKNWTLHERYQIKFAMDFFDILNHPNFNSSSLEGAGYAPATLTCGNAACSATNRVVTAQSAVTGFGSVSALQPGKSNRELQYSLRFQF